MTAKTIAILIEDLMARVWLTRRVRAAEKRLKRPLTIGEASRMWCAGPDGWQQRGPQTDRYAATTAQHFVRIKAEMAAGMGEK